jgi:hypothetical protein
MNNAINSGLVFAIPLAEKTFGFGQLIAWQRPIFYMAGYDMNADSPDPNGQDITRAAPALLGNFFDILIRSGRWLPIGKMETPKVPFPCFKIRTEDSFRVESWDRQQMREATSDECSALQFRSNHSAIVLENALKAHFGLSPWEPRFDSLKVDAVAKSSRMFSHN